MSGLRRTSIKKIFLGSFILLLVTLFFRLYFNRSITGPTDTFIDARKNTPLKLNRDLREAKEKFIEKKKKGEKKRKRLLRHEEVCAKMKPSEEALNLFEYDLAKSEVVFSKFAEIVDELENNLMISEKYGHADIQEDQLCPILKEQFSHLDYFVKEHKVDKKKMAYVVEVKYIALAYHLISLESYPRLIMAQGLFMNILNQGVLNSSEEKELRYLYDRTKEDYKNFMVSSDVTSNPSVKYKLDKNGRADYILFLEWLGNLETSND